MEPLTIHINTRTGERTINSETPGMNGSEDVQMDNDYVRAEANAIEAEAPAPILPFEADLAPGESANTSDVVPTPPRGPSVARRGGVRPANLSNRKAIVRPNPDHLQNLTALAAQRPDDLRNELNRNRNNNSSEAMEVDMGAVSEGATIAKTIEGNAASEIPVDDAEGIEVEFPDYSDEIEAPPEEQDLRCQLRNRSPTKHVSSRSEDVSYVIDESQEEENVEEDRLSLTADDDIELVPAQHSSKTAEKGQQFTQKSSGASSKATPKPSSSSSSQQATSKNSSTQNNGSKPPEKSERSERSSELKNPPERSSETRKPAEKSEKSNGPSNASSHPVKMPPAKPSSSTSGGSTPSRAPERPSLKQPPAKPDTKAPPPKPQESSFSKSSSQPPTKPSEKSSSSASSSRPPPPKIDLSKGSSSDKKSSSASVKVDTSHAATPAKTEAKAPCQACSSVQSVDNRLCSLLKLNQCRPRKKDDLDLMPQKDFQDFATNISEIARRAGECKMPSVTPLILNLVVANGRIDDKMLAELLPRVIVSGGLAIKDFQLHIRPIVEQCCRSTSDPTVQQQFLGLYWYFADWFGLWETVLKLVYHPSLKPATPSRNLSPCILKNLCRLVITVSSDRAGLVAWLISNLSKKDVNANFKPNMLSKLIPLLDKRSLYKLRVKIEDCIGSKPKEDDLKARVVNEKMTSFGRRLQNFLAKKQSIGLPDELPFLNPGADDIIAEICFTLRHLSNDDMVVDSYNTFLSFFTSRTLSDFPDLKRLCGSVIFYLTRFVKSKSTIIRLLSKLEKAGIEFSNYLNDEALAGLPGEFKMTDVSLKIAESIAADYANTFPDIKSKSFLWMTGPTFIPLTKISNQDEFSSTVRQKASFFNNLLAKIPDSAVSAQHCDYFAQLVKAFSNDVSSNSNFKDEHKSLFDFEKVYHRMCVNCVKTQRTALLTDLFEHTSCSSLFPKSNGHPNELTFRLFVVAFALREDKAKSITAYRLACSSSIFSVQPDSTIEGCVVIKVPSYFTEPEMMTLFVSTLDCAWKLYQDGTFGPTTLPQFGIKVEQPRSDVSNESISILTCSQSEDQVYQRVRSVLTTTLGVHFQRLPSGLMKLDAKDVVTLFGSWKSSSRPPSYPKFEPTAEKLTTLAREASAFKPVAVSSAAESRNSTGSGSGAKRPAPVAEKSAQSAGPPNRGATNGQPNKPSPAATAPNNNDEQFKIPKRSRIEDSNANGTGSPPKMARQGLLSNTNGPSANRQPPERRRASDRGSEGRPTGSSYPPPPNAGRDFDNRKQSGAPTGANNTNNRDERPRGVDRGVAEDPLRTTEKLLRRVGQYLQGKDMEQMNPPGRPPADPTMAYPPPQNEPHRPIGASMSMPPQLNSKLVEAATSAVFAAVRDATGATTAPQPAGVEPGITRAWEEFEERRSASATLRAAVSHGASYGAQQSSVNPYVYATAPQPPTDPTNPYGGGKMGPVSGPGGPYGSAAPEQHYGMEQRPQPQHQQPPQQQQPRYPPPPSIGYPGYPPQPPQPQPPKQRPPVSDPYGSQRPYVAQPEPQVYHQSEPQAYQQAAPRSNQYPPPPKATGGQPPVPSEYRRNPYEQVMVQQTGPGPQPAPPRGYYTAAAENAAYGNYPPTANSGMYPPPPPHPWPGMQGAQQPPANDKYGGGSWR